MASQKQKEPYYETVDEESVTNLIELNAIDNNEFQDINESTNTDQEIETVLDWLENNPTEHSVHGANLFYELEQECKIMKAI